MRLERHVLQPQCRTWEVMLDANPEEHHEAQRHKEKAFIEDAHQKEGNQQWQGQVLQSIQETCGWKQAQHWWQN